MVEFVRRQGEAAGLCDVRPSGSITIGRLGEQLSPLGELSAAGVHLFTDDGDGCHVPRLMRRALDRALAACRTPATAGHHIRWAGAQQLIDMQAKLSSFLASYGAKHFEVQESMRRAP